MPILADQIDAVVGVDTHTDTHTAVLANHLGAVLAETTVATTPAGLAELLAFAAEHAPGERLVWAVEGCRSHGAGLFRLLGATGQQVYEVRPSARRARSGKSDPLDALAAARAVLAEQTRFAQPRSDGHREALRVLTVTRRHLTDVKTATTNLIKALLLTAVDTELRERLRDMRTHDQVATLLQLRNRAGMPTEHRVLRTQLRAHARAVRDLEGRLADNHDQLKTLVEESMPELLQVSGVGPVNAAELLIAWSHPGRFTSEAAFAMAAGAAPIQASSGRHQRHRLNRGGDRRLNCALYNIAINRSRTDPETRAYIERRRTEHKTDREIRRCLNRYLARRLFGLMNGCSNPLIHTA